MRFRLRFTLLVLLGILLFAPLTTDLAQEPTEPITITVESKTIEAGQTTTIQVTADPATPIGAIQGTLRFNSGVVRVQSVSFARNFNLNAKNILAGEVRFTGVATTRGQPVLSGLLISFEIQAIGSSGSESPLELELQVLGDPEFRRLPHEIIPGTLTIEGGVPPQPPKAEFSFSPDNPKVGETISFDASTSSDPDGQIVKYDWDFGDGFTLSGSEQTPLHTYTSAGEFTVKLIVTDDDGLTGTQTQRIKVLEVTSQPPKAEFKFDPEDPKVDETVQFTDQSTDADGQITSWDWDFGDGSTSTEQNPTHSYTTAGSFTVTLAVTDNDDLTNTTSKTITVLEPGAPEVRVHNFPNPASTLTVFKYSLPRETTSAVLRVFDLTGRLVLQQELDVTQTESSWDLTDNAGNPVPNGPYYYFIAARQDGRVIRSPTERLVIQLSSE